MAWKRFLRRMQKRPLRLARRMRKDVLHIIKLSREVAKAQEDILKLAQENGEDKKKLKILRSEVSGLITDAQTEVDYFVKVFVDAEVLVMDIYMNIMKNLNGALARLEQGGFDKKMMVSLKGKFDFVRSRLNATVSQIRLLARKAEKGRGGVSMASTVHLEKEIKRASKLVYQLRDDIAGAFSRLAEEEEELDVSGVQESLNRILNDVNAELDAVMMVAQNNRVLIKRFKLLFRDFASKFNSTRIPEDVKNVLSKAVSSVEAYEDKALRKARRIAFRSESAVT